MGKTLDRTGPKHHVAEIVQHGEALVLPEEMTADQAIKLLQRRKKYEEETTVIRRSYDVFPWDGANALVNAMSKRYGWATAEPTPGFFGDNPPQMIDIEVGPGQSKQITWGRFSLPNIDGFLQCSTSRKNGRLIFELVSEVKRKHEGEIQLIFDMVADELRLKSIYQGQAVKIRFRDNDGDPISMPTPSFMDLTGVSRDMLIYSQHVTDLVETNLFTPVERVADCLRNKLPIKRGVLLGGPYGTGKTLAATVAARLAVDNNVTFIYVERAAELADAIKFAHQYQGDTAAVVFCEDIDRTTSGERDVAMDDILNILDGADTKSSRVITVLTTNHIENINPAMLRPGRLDAVINVTPPDAEAVERLIRLYAGDTLDAKTDISEAARLLDGTIPAVIAEVVKRAKLAQLRLQDPNTKIEKISGEAVLLAAQTIQGQIDLLRAQSERKEREPTFNEVIGEAVRSGVNGMQEQMHDVHRMVCR